MKKLLLLAAAIFGIAAYIYYYFSAPQVIERRLDSLLGTLSFGIVSLGNLDKEGDRFVSHFASEVTFSGSGNDILAGSVEPAELRDLYLGQFRTAAKSAQASLKGDATVQILSPNRAKMKATIQLDMTLRDNMSYPQTLPVELVWKKSDRQWQIAEVQMLAPRQGEF